MACTERCACRTLSQSARGTALSKSFLKLEHPTFWIQQKARRWEGMNNHCCSVWLKTYPCPAEPRLIVRTMGTARAAGRWSGRATAACVCTAAEVSSACICVWLERRTSAAQSETASAALLTKHRQERAVPAPSRMVVGPCVLLSLGWMDVALQPCAVLHFGIDTRPQLHARPSCTRSCRLKAQLQPGLAAPSRGNAEQVKLSPAFKIGVGRCPTSSLVPLTPPADQGHVPTPKRRVAAAWTSSQ